MTWLHRLREWLHWLPQRIMEAVFGKKDNDLGEND